MVCLPVTLISFEFWHIYYSLWNEDHDIYKWWPKHIEKYTNTGYSSFISTNVCVMLKKKKNIKLIIVVKLNFHFNKIITKLLFYCVKWDLKKVITIFLTLKKERKKLNEGTDQVWESAKYPSSSGCQQASTTSKSASFVSSYGSLISIHISTL